MTLRGFLAVLLFLVPAVAFGQASPTGGFTPGHPLTALTPSGSPYADAGGPAGSPIFGSGYLTGLGITNTGTPFCINDALTSGPYHQLCLGANALGSGLMSYNAYNGASPLGLTVNLNGTNINFASGVPMGADASNAILPAALTNLGAMGSNASNAILPTALNNLGLGTGSSPTFAGMTVTGNAAITGNLTVSGSFSNPSLMASNASNAILPDTLNNLGLGTASTPTFGGLTVGGALTVTGATALGTATATTEAVGGATLGTASFASPTLKLGGSAATLGNAIAIFQRQSPSATDTFDVHIKRVPAYSGGTAGVGNYALYVESNPHAGINTNESAILGTIDSNAVYADAGQGSPIFSQFTKEATGYGFGIKIQVNDINKTTTPTHEAIAAEIAMKASHPDPGVAARLPFGSRSGVHISATPLASGYDGSPPGFSSGIKISGDGGATIHSGLLFDAYTLSGSDDTSFTNLIGAQGNLSVLGNAIDLGSIVTPGNLFVGPGFRIGNNGVVKGAGSVAVAPGASVVNTSQAQSGSTNLLAVASTASISVGQTVTGANIPAGDQVVAVVKELEYTSTANGVSASGQNLLNVISFTGVAKGMQCTDVTTPGAIGAGNIVTNVSTVLPAVITLTSNLLAPTVNGDTIVCDPVVTLATATTGTNGVGVALTFGSPIAGMISYTTPNKWDAGIVVDSNAMSSSTKAVFAVQNFGTDPTDTYTSEWDANGAIKVTAATVSGATQLTGAVTMSSTLNVVGALSNNGTPPTGSGAVVEATGPTISGATLSGTTTATLVTGLNAPTNGPDAVNKTYADAISSGIVTHAAAQAATTANLSATASGTGVGKTLTNNSTQAAFAVDGYSASVNDRILVKDQTTQKDNGIYTVTTVGSGASNWVLTRATDFDQASASEVAVGASVIVVNGTVNAHTNWVETGQGPFTVDTTAIIFSQVTAGSNGSVNSGTIHQFGEYSAAGTAISGIGPFTGLIDGQGAGGVAINYAGTSCTNQFPRSLNAHGAATCATVGTADLASSLSLTTPTLGVASATTINKWSFTAPATAATLTAGADGLTYTMPPTSQTIVGVTSTQNLSNKTYERWTFTAPATAATLTAGGDNLTYTMPAASKTIMASDYSNASATTLGSTTLTLGGTTTSISGLTLPSPTFSGTVVGANTIPLSILAQSATNTVLGNSTSGTANVTALSVGGCSSSSSALIWTTNTGFGCNAAIAASTVVTNANLTGPVTSSGNATAIAAGAVTNAMLAGSIQSSKLLAFAHTQKSVSAPTGTTSTTGVMMGLAGTITPTNSGTVSLKVCGDAVSTAIGDGMNVQLRVSSVAGQAAPTNAAALTGTTLGSLRRMVASTVAGRQSWCVIGTATGLTLASAYWIDVGLAAVTGGTASIGNVDIVADEMP